MSEKISIELSEQGPEEHQNVMRTPEQVRDFTSSRRDFMKAMALVFTGTAAYAMTPNFAYAESHNGHDDTLDTPADVCYTLFPHKTVPRKFYLACAQGLLDKAAGDEDLQATLDAGLKRLNRIYSRPYSELDDGEKDMAIQRVRMTPFFATVRGHTVVGLYNIPDVWDYFGYQGPSFEKGGYLRRGFDDIYWLDDLLDADEYADDAEGDS